MALTQGEIDERRLEIDIEAAQSYRKVDSARALSLQAMAVMYVAIAVAALALAVRLIF